jgi:hypothetical protein
MDVTKIVETTNEFLGLKKAQNPWGFMGFNSG